MIVLVARYYVKTGQSEAVETALERMAPLVAAHEPGCKLYHVCRSQENPNFFLLYEQYVDEAALLTHRETPHFKEIIEGTILPLLEKRERELYTLVIGSVVR
jgi:quinol monooxygenase YgiN